MEKIKKELFVFWSVSLRIMHIALFLAVILAILTGIPLKYYEYSFATYLLNLTGGYFVTKLIHNAMGVIIVTITFIHLGTIMFTWIRNESFFKTLNIMFNKDDMKVVINALPYLFFIKKKIEYGRYTTFQKIDYFVLLICLVALSLSGLFLMFPVASTAFFSISWLPVSLYLHSSLSMFFIVFIMMSHLFNTHISPNKLFFNLVWLTGTLTEEKLKEFHVLEYNKIEKKETALKEEYEKKVEELSKKDTVKKEQKMLEDYLQEGNAFVQNGNYSGAIEKYKEAIQIYPNFSQARFNIGVAYKKNNQNEEAIAAFKEFVKMDPFNEMSEQAKSIIKNLTAVSTKTKESNKDNDGKAH